MLKNKLLVIVLTLTLLVGVLTACGGNKQAGKLVDGDYKVSASDFDSHGYKAQLELIVSGGKITDVKYDEVSKDGTLKSQDPSYKEKMEATAKTYPAKAYQELIQQVISKQTANVDTVSGATASSTNFKALIKYAVDEMASKGSTTPATVTLKEGK